MKQAFLNFAKRGYRRASVAADIAIIRLLNRRGGAQKDGFHLLLAAPGGGNIGDQAMADVFAQNVDGNIVIIASGPSALVLPAYGNGSREFVLLPGLMSRNIIRHTVALFAFGALLRRARSFSVTGADIMDGGYSDRASAVRWSLVLGAATTGVPTRVLGFSWNERPSALAVRLAQKAASVGVTLLSRDPRSHARMTADGIRDVVPTADTVFMLDAFDPDTQWFAAAEASRSEARKVAIVNVSALVSRRVKQLAEYSVIVEKLQSLGYDVFLLPHVDRGPHGDIHEATELWRHLNDPRVVLISELLRPAQIRSLLTKADVVVSGRMHLAIMALSLGVPPFVISTQGKVEGLADLFDTPGLSVDATPGLGVEIANRVETLFAGAAGARERIESLIPRARELSSRNFNGLTI